MAVIAHGVEWPQPIYVCAEDGGAELSLRRVAQSWKRVDVVPAEQLRGAVAALEQIATMPTDPSLITSNPEVRMRQLAKRWLSDHTGGQS